MGLDKLSPDKELDLRAERDRQRLYAMAAPLADTDGELREFRLGLEALAGFFQKPDWLVLQPHMGGSLLLTKGKFHRVHHLTSLATFGWQLEKLAKCVGFDALMRELENLSQFEDAMFEVACAATFVQRDGVGCLRLKPRYEVRGHAKRPDFEMDVPGETNPIVCECKSADENARRYTKQLSRVMSILSSVLAKHGGLPSGVRLEVHIDGPRRRRTEEIAEELGSWVAGRPPLGQVAHFGNFRACVKRAGSPLTFQERDYLQGQFTVSDEPRGILPKDADILLSVTDLFARRASALGRILRTANCHSTIPA